MKNWQNINFRKHEFPRNHKAAEENDASYYSTALLNKHSSLQEMNLDSMALAAATAANGASQYQLTQSNVLTPNTKNSSTFVLTNNHNTATDQITSVLGGPPRKQFRLQLDDTQSMPSMVEIPIERTYQDINYDPSLSKYTAVYKQNGDLNASSHDIKSDELECTCEKNEIGHKYHELNRRSSTPTITQLQKDSAQPQFYTKIGYQPPKQPGSSARNYPPPDTEDAVNYSDVIRTVSSGRNDLDESLYDDGTRFHEFRQRYQDYDPSYQSFEKKYDDEELRRNYSFVVKSLYQLEEDEQDLHGYKVNNNSNNNNSHYFRK